MADTASTYYDRRVPPLLMEALREGGPLYALIERRNTDRTKFDVQLRAKPGSQTAYVTLYLGLTSILDVEVNGRGTFRLRTHPTHQARGGFDPSWAQGQSLDQLSKVWVDVEYYLDRVVPTVDPHHLRHEGLVHAAICSGHASSYRVIDREAVIGFHRDKASICARFRESIEDALKFAAVDEAGWPGGHHALKTFGTGLDILAVDTAGRLLVMEAKANASSDIALAPVQVRFYAELFAHWGKTHPDAIKVLDGMLSQRVALGLSESGASGLADPLVVVPVVAIGAGKVSTTALSRLWQIADALNRRPMVESGIEPLAVWQLDNLGERRTNQSG